MSNGEREVWGNSTPDRTARECAATTSNVNDTSTVSVDSGVGQSPTNVTLGDTSRVDEFTAVAETSIVCLEDADCAHCVISNAAAPAVAEGASGAGLFLRFDSSAHVCDMSSDVDMTPSIGAAAFATGESGHADLDADLNSSMSSMSVVVSPVMVQDDNNENHETETTKLSTVACSHTSSVGGCGDASAEFYSLGISQSETTQSNKDLNLTESGDHEFPSTLSTTNNGATSDVDEDRPRTDIVQPETDAESSLSKQFDFGIRKRRPKKKIQQVLSKSAESVTNPTDLVRKYFRSPFLLPSVDDVHVSKHSFKTVGNFQEFIDNPDRFMNIDGSTDAVLYTHLLRILYHCSEGMYFFHVRGFVVGCVRPEKIVLDKYLNARLSFCEFGSEIAKEKDIENFGVLMLNVLCRQNQQNFDTLKHKLKHDHDFQFIEIMYDQFIDKTVWSAKDVTLNLLKLIIQCLDSSFDSKVLKDSLKKQCRLPLITWPEQKCLYCCFEFMSDTDIKAYSQLSLCQANCPFLKMCLDCMRIVCCYPLHVSPRFVCPQHGDILCSAIGGSEAWAYMIRSKYIPINGHDYQQTFDRDRERIHQILAHPRVFGIPRTNVLESELNIPCGDGAVTADQTYRNNMIEKIQMIADKRAKFFLLYYSGHHEPLEHFKEYLLNALSYLRQSCPHILIILDCCYAHSLDFVPRLVDDEFMVWHIQWSSCKSCEQANVVPGDVHSLFTKYLLCALQGAFQCADVVFCNMCDEFQCSCEQQRCIMFHDLSEYVKKHMERKLKSMKGNYEQHPCFTCHASSTKCPIAFFPRKKLFELNYESPAMSDLSSGTLDDIGVFDQMLCNLWSTFKNDLPRHLHYRALQIYGGLKSVDLNRVEDIVDSDLGNDLLWFKVRSSGSELDVGKMVAFVFTQREAAHYEPHIGLIPNGMEASKVIQNACNPSGGNIAPFRDGVDRELTTRQVHLLYKHVKSDGSTRFFKFLKDTCEKYRELSKLAIETPKPLVVRIYTNLVLVCLKGDED